MSLPWNTDFSNLPNDVPILVRTKNTPLCPMMVVWCADYEPDCVGCILGPVPDAYGFYYKIDSLQDWLKVV